MHATFYLRGTGLSFHFKLFYFLFNCFEIYEDFDTYDTNPLTLNFKSHSPQAIFSKSLFLHRPKGGFVILVLIM